MHHWMTSMQDISHPLSCGQQRLSQLKYRHTVFRLGLACYTFTQVFTEISNVSLAKKKSAISRATAVSEKGFKTKRFSEL